jgi:hypothetical protein
MSKKQAMAQARILNDQIADLEVAVLFIEESNNSTAIFAIKSAITELRKLAEAN